jgi:hypothetical protein
MVLYDSLVGISYTSSWIVGAAACAYLIDSSEIDVAEGRDL